MKQLRKEIEKYIKTINGRVAYEGYADCPTIEETKSKYLIETFPEWKNQFGFLTGIYNLSKWFNSVEELKQHCRHIENKFKFDPTYYVAGEKYYVRSIKADNVWEGCVIDIQPAEEADESWVALSNLKQYMMDRPNLVCWNTVINDVDKKTAKKLIHDGLMIQPDKNKESYLL